MGSLDVCVVPKCPRDSPASLKHPVWNGGIVECPFPGREAKVIADHTCQAKGAVFTT